MILRVFQRGFQQLLTPLVGDVWFFGDEIKAERGRLPVSGRGSLLVPSDYRVPLLASLELGRDGFAGQVHFTDIRDGGLMYRAAQNWVESFFREHIRHISFKATFALHDGPQALPYPGEDGYQKHAIHNMSSNVVGHVRYTQHRLDRLRVRPVYDHTDNARERMFVSEGLMTAQSRMNERRRKGNLRYPDVRIDHARFQPSDARHATTLDEAINAPLLQLTDVLIGSAAQAMKFMPTIGKLWRRRLARRVIDEIASRWGRSTYLFNHDVRHFSVSLYPDEMGRMYAPVPQASLTASGRQLDLKGL